MSEAKQVVFVPGGEAFTSNEDFYEFLREQEYEPHPEPKKRWRDDIQEQLEAVGYEWFFAGMPNRLNADYTAWAIWFEKILPHLQDGVVFVGHSLGGGFLLRYLTENTLPVAPRQLHLVAACIDELDCPGAGPFGIDVANWPGFAVEVGELHLWHSADDTIVPIQHSERLATLLPAAHLHRFSDRFHFIGAEFPELLATIKT